MRTPNHGGSETSQRRGSTAPGLLALIWGFEEIDDDD